MTMNELALHCPHCGHANDDPFEIFDSGKLEWTRCFICEKSFHFFIADCEKPGCGREAAFVWAALPSAHAIAALQCPACQHLYSCPDIQGDRQ